MGQTADDMISGVCCSGCGVYFAGEHGYPVLCETCWGYETQELGTAEIDVAPRAILPELGEEEEG